MSGGLASLLRGTLYVQLSATQLKGHEARTPISDFTVAEQLLRGSIRRLVGRAVFAPSPRIGE